MSKAQQPTFENPQHVVLSSSMSYLVGKGIFFLSSNIQVNKTW